MTRGGSRPGAGRPRGATTRLPAAEVATRLAHLLGDDETWEDVARKLGVHGSAVRRAVAEGLGAATLTRWLRPRE